MKRKKGGGDEELQFTEAPSVQNLDRATIEMFQDEEYPQE